jgi:uncharacterized protein (TIGR00297 family)
MPILKTLFEASAQDWIRFVLFLSGIVLFILLAEKTRTALGWSAEVTRKLVHVLTGVLIVFSPLFFSSPKPLLWMAALFTVVNFIGVETGKLKGMHDTRRKSFGTVFYPLTFFILVASCWNGHKAVLILAMMVLAFSDAAAAAVGELLRAPHEYRLGADKKSLEGSAAMFAVSALLIAAFLPALAARDGLDVAWRTAAWIAVLTAVVSAALEAVSSKGSDNLTAPLGAAFVIQFMLAGGPDARWRLTVGAVLAAVLALGSLRFRFLNASGAVAAFVLAAFLFGVGGWQWAAPILFFFLSSSMLSKTGKERKRRFESFFEKTSTRDLGQVMANGGIGGLLVALHGLFPDPAWYALYLGAVAAVNADTWATELGTFSKARPVRITDFRPVEAGTSGAVSPLGLASAGLASFLIALIGWFSAPSLFPRGLADPLVWSVTAAGFLAALADSVLGATLQAQYRCPVCGKNTERKNHCRGAAADRISGLRWISNDVVNLLCSAAGAAAVWLMR